MALVTREDIGEDGIYTIKTLFAPLTVNMLFTFLNTLNPSLNRDFRLSLDNGATWQSWLDLTDENIRAININPSIKVVIQVRYSPNASFLLINDSGDVNLINDSGDAILIS
jgi:hypothetical protein